MAGATLFVSNAAPAQPGGSNVLHIIVPFAAGGVQDILARSISNELGTLLGQTVIVENKPGAGGTVGTGQVAKAPADGKTVVMAAASHLIAPHLYSKLAYDSSKDFVPGRLHRHGQLCPDDPSQRPRDDSGRFHQVREGESGEAQLRVGGRARASKRRRCPTPNSPGCWDRKPTRSRRSSSCQA